MRKKQHWKTRRAIVLCSLEISTFINVLASISLVRQGFYVFVIRAWLQLNWVQLRLNSSEKSKRDDQRIHIHLCVCAMSVTPTAIYKYLCRWEKLRVCLCRTSYSGFLILPCTLNHCCNATIHDLGGSLPWKSWSGSPVCACCDLTPHPPQPAIGSGDSITWWLTCASWEAHRII